MEEEKRERKLCKIKHINDEAAEDAVRKILKDIEVSHLDAVIMLLNVANIMFYYVDKNDLMKEFLLFLDKFDNQQKNEYGFFYFLSGELIRSPELKAKKIDYKVDEDEGKL